MIVKTFCYIISLLNLDCFSFSICDSNFRLGICVEIDKRMTLLGLKRHLALIIGTRTRSFCLYRQYAGGQEVNDSRIAQKVVTVIIKPKSMFHP